MSLKNKVIAIISQVVEESERKRAFDNTVTFEDETVMPITAGVLSDWFVCKLRQYLKIQRLQRLVGFKLNDRVVVQLKVNNKEQMVSMKLSLNTERLEKVLETTPELVAEVFTPSPSIGALANGKQDALAYIRGESRQIVIAEHAKPAEKKPRKPRKMLQLPVNNSLEGNPMLELETSEHSEAQGIESVLSEVN